MKSILINTVTGQSRIIIGESLKQARMYLPDTKMAIITDTNVSRLYRSNFPEGLIIETEPGEQSKSLEGAAFIYESLMNFELDRSGFILGIGGGIVCDLAGFVGSTYLRGVRFGFVATTLLSQVDAGIGGKNGVNLKGFKNIVGVINQPEFVICDPDLLKTLPRKEFIGGLSEVIKYGAIFDEELFIYAENNLPGMLQQDKKIIDHLITGCIQHKCRVVEEDERETGERMKLNFGHTFGHALEKITGLSHGEAISIGMNIAADISVKLGCLSINHRDRLKFLLQSVGLPVALDVSPGDLYDAIRKDKKKVGNEMGLVLINKPGSSFIHYLEMDLLKNILNDLY